MIRRRKGSKDDSGLIYHDKPLDYIFKASPSNPNKAANKDDSDSISFPQEILSKTINI